MDVWGLEKKTRKKTPSEFKLIKLVQSRGKKATVDASPGREEGFKLKNTNKKIGGKGA